MIAAAPSRAVHVEHCMGTVFTIDIRDLGSWGGAISDVVAWLHHVDSVFSSYKTDSDVSRIQRRQLRLDDADPEVGTVLELCAQVQIATGGAFTAVLNGRLDATGLVKGWAIERGSQLLQAHGSGNHAINGGGDMQLAGEAEPGRPWTVGISDPQDRTRIMTTVSGRDFAVATSGTAERGRHILDPFTGRPTARVASTTITGPSLTYADCYATAAFVMGPDAIQWIEHVDSYEVLVVRTDGSARVSSGWT